MQPTLFAHCGFINTGIFQILVTLTVGLFVLPAIALNFLMDWNFLDAVEDAFYSGWWWLISQTVGRNSFFESGTSTTVKHTA